MKFSAAAIVAFAAAVLAQPKLLNSAYNLQEGQPFTLSWGNAQGPVTITLMTGPDPNNLRQVQEIATGQTGTTFTFTPSNLPSGTYAFRITDSSGQPNYSPSFLYQGTGTLPSTTGSSSSSSISVTSTSALVSSTATNASSTSSSSLTSSASSITSGASSTTSGASSTAASASSTSASRTFSTTTSSSTRQPSSTTPPNNNSGHQRFASPLGLVLVTVAALVLIS